MKTFSSGQNIRECQLIWVDLQTKFSFCQIRVYTADTSKLKEIILQKIPLNFVILNWNTETWANIPSHIFAGVVFTGHETLITLNSGRDLKMSTLMPTIKFYKQHFLPTSSGFFLDNLFANLNIIFFGQSKQPIYTSFSNSLEFLIKLILVQIKINIRQLSRTFFQRTFSSNRFLEASLWNLVRPLYF